MVLNHSDLRSAVRLVSICVGRPQTLDKVDPWTTAFFKTPVEGPVRLWSTNLEGDEQADRRVHGGVVKAVCGYSADHYPAWRHELGRADMGYGGFGENFTITGQTDDDVCIGDRFRIGTAVVEVSQPRGPCWKLARRWNRPGLPQRVVETGRSGWYFRVLEEGYVEAGNALLLLQRPHEWWTIRRVNAITYAAPGARPSEEAAALASCPALAASWRRSVVKRLSFDQRTQHL
jgi:MOSC domain-containing protein YiiM